MRLTLPTDAKTCVKQGLFARDRDAVAGSQNPHPRTDAVWFSKTALHGLVKRPGQGPQELKSVGRDVTA